MLHLSSFSFAPLPRNAKVLRMALKATAAMDSLILLLWLFFFSSIPLPPHPFYYTSRSFARLFVPPLTHSPESYYFTHYSHWWYSSDHFVLLSSLEDLFSYLFVFLTIIGTHCCSTNATKRSVPLCLSLSLPRTSHTYSSHLTFRCLGLSFAFIFFNSTTSHS